MSSLIFALTVWGLVFLAGLAGMAIGGHLPERHRDGESRAMVTLTMALVATVTAVVLGLLLSNAASSFRESQRQVVAISGDLMRADRLLRAYGPDGDGVRALLRRYAVAKQHDLFPSRGKAGDVDNGATLGILGDLEVASINLKPTEPTQNWLRGEVLAVCAQISDARWRLVSERHDDIPNALMAGLVLWLAMLFGSFGLFAPRHATSIAALMMSSLAAASAILLIIDLENPNGGFVRLSDTPLRYAIAAINR